MRYGRMQVVGTEHERAWPVEEGAERIKEVLHRLLVRDGIPGIDHQVRIEVIKRPDPGHEPLPARGEMRVGNMKHPQFARARRQDGNLKLAQSKPVPLDHRRVADRGAAEGGGDREEGSQSHFPMVP